MKFKTTLILLLLAITACTLSPITMAVTPTPAPISLSTPISKISPTATEHPTQSTPPTLVPVATSTPEPSATPSLFPPEAEKIRSLMETYGQINEKQLSPQYWERLKANIAKYGPAKRILTLEFHGDDYSMYGGAYSMMPETFADEMDYLMRHDYHFVTGVETIGFVEGWLELPARSVILTTDSGNGSANSMSRITTLFRELEIKYGYAPHMQSFIWTSEMTPDESVRCKNDACWQFIRDARDSGYFTFGTHTESHGDFSTFTLERTDSDLRGSLAEIKENAGLTAFSITWPFEACSPYEELLRDLGIKVAYGGWSRSANQLFTYAHDPQPLCLPRLFPPNPDGGSGRPKGMTLKEMLSFAEDQYTPVP